MELQLREYQRKAVLDIQNHLRSDKRPAIVSMATAGGKSIVIAKLAEWCAKHPDYRVLIVTHRKELLKQNRSKILHNSVGMVSAGLGKKEWGRQITIGGIQSVYKKIELLGQLKLIIIDEVHRVCNDKKGNTMYWRLLNAYPEARIVGLTATPFRLEDGALNWGKLIHHTSYTDLLKQNFVSPIQNKVTYEPDLSHVRKTGGEYVISELDKLYENEQVFRNAIEKIVAYGADRNSWIGFVPSIKLGTSVKIALESYGIIVGMISHKTHKKEREHLLESFLEGKIKCIVNVNVLTEGFDNPKIDMIFCIRPTLSLGLWHQMMGRGVRLHESKKECLLLDFAGNLQSHGGLADDSWIHADGEVKKKMDVDPNRVCPKCEEFTPKIEPLCSCCKYEFEKAPDRKANHKDSVDHDTDINERKEVLKWFNVTKVEYEPSYKSKAGNIMLKVNYRCGFTQIWDFVWPSKERDWRERRGGGTDFSKLRTPKRIYVNTATKFPKILQYEW